MLAFHFSMSSAVCIRLPASAVESLAGSDSIHSGAVSSLIGRVLRSRSGPRRLDLSPSRQSRLLTSRTGSDSRGSCVSLSCSRYHDDLPFLASPLRGVPGVSSPQRSNPLGFGRFEAQLSGLSVSLRSPNLPKLRWPLSSCPKFFPERRLSQSLSSLSPRFPFVYVGLFPRSTSSSSRFLSFSPCSRSFGVRISPLPRPPVKGPKADRLGESIGFVEFRPANAEVKAVLGGPRIISVGTFEVIRPTYENN